MREYFLERQTSMPSDPSPFEIDIATLSYSSLRHRCAEESQRFFRRLSYDDRYCYELFRRAIINRDEHAWELIYSQYLPLVTSWVERHSLFLALNEESQYFVNGAFQKMWLAVKPEKFSTFENLKALLRYLQMCVHSVLIDYMRARELAELLDEHFPDHNQPVMREDMEAEVLARVGSVDLWNQIAERLKDERERRVIYNSFVYCLKPADIYQANTDLFKDVHEVYMVKDNVLARLRRDKELLVAIGEL